MNKKFGVGFFLNIAFYSLLAIVLAVLQTTLLPRFQIYEAFPDLMIGAVCCIGIYRGENTAALFGLLAGLIVESTGNAKGLSLLPLFYTLAGYISGRIGFSAKENARFPAYLVSVPFFCLARTALTVLYHVVRYFKSVDVLQLLLYTALPEFFYTLCLCVPVFFFVKLFDIPLNFIRKRGGLD